MTSYVRNNNNDDDDNNNQTAGKSLKEGIIDNNKN